MSDKNTDDATKKKRDQRNGTIMLMVIILLVVTFCSASSKKFRESVDTVKLPDGWSENDAEVRGLMDLVRSYGYTCDTINRVVIKSNGGYRIICNKYKYSYDAEDVGGTWVVKVR